MRSSELARNAGAIALGLLISGAIVFGQSGGKWPRAAAALADENTELPLPRASFPAGPHPAPAGCVPEEATAIHDAEAGNDPADPVTTELMQTQ